MIEQGRPGDLTKN